MNKKEAVYLIDCLAKGFDPFSGDSIESESVFNNVAFVRKLYELRDYINENIEEARIKKEPFSLKTKEGIVDGPMNITSFIDRINEVNFDENMKKFTRTPVMDWIYQEGYLILEGDKKNVTEKGKGAGIYFDHRVSLYGKQYDVILYPEDFLKHILDLIEKEEIA